MNNFELTWSDDDRILIGSVYFFNCYEDFIIHDYDYIILINSSFPKNKSFFHLFNHNTKSDLGFYNTNDKNFFINNVLKYETPNMFMQKFLVPEFAQAIGFTFEDLDRFKFIVNDLDPKHEYIKTIYYSYIENGDFYLTKQQLDDAYAAYKEARKDIYE